LVNLNSILGRSAEAKCLAINARRPEQIAVGANDPYIRVFDRRKLKAQLIEVRRKILSNLTPKPA
jgi:WD and tetratricopeptide repeat-containing protein 1